MSIMLYFFKAGIVGLAISAPVGPIGMLCIKKTLEIGFKGALLVGLGAALADAAYGMVAALGLSVVSDFMLDQTNVIKLIGGALLLYLAYKEARSKNTGQEAAISSKNSIALVTKIFFLTLANPMTILSFIAIFSSISNTALTTLECSAIIVGIFCGAMIWWLMLGSLINKVKHKLSKTWLGYIKWFAAFVLASFGIATIVSGLLT